MMAAFLFVVGGMNELCCLIYSMLKIAAAIHQ